MGNVTDVDFSIKWENVVFTEGVELDGPLDHLAVAAIRIAAALGLEDLK